MYVNAQVDDNTEISELMKLFKSSGTEGNEKFPRISRAIKHFKTGKGRNIMCEAVEEYAKEAAKETAKETEKQTIRNMVVNMLKENMSDETIIKVAKISEEELEAIKSEAFKFE